MGSQLNLQNESDNKYVQSIYNIGRIMFRRFINPLRHNKFIHYKLTGDGRAEMRNIALINNFTNKVIEKRKKEFNEFQAPNPSDENRFYSTKKKLAMLDLLLNARATNGSISDEGIIDEVNTIMFEVMCNSNIIFW